MEIENIIFDFNGTILDDLDICYNLLNEMLISKNHKPVSLDTYLHIFNFPIYDYYKKAGFNFEKEPIDDFKELSQYFYGKYYSNFNTLKIFDDVYDFLKNYHSKYNLYILSATNKADLDRIIASLNIDQYFKDLIGTSDIYGKAKLDVAISYFNKNKIDFNKTMFIGDTLHDNDIAKYFKAKSVLIARGHQAKDVLEQGNPDYLLNNMNQVIEILKEDK